MPGYPGQIRWFSLGSVFDVLIYKAAKRSVESETHRERMMDCSVPIASEEVRHPFCSVHPSDMNYDESIMVDSEPGFSHLPHTDYRRSVNPIEWTSGFAFVFWISWKHHHEKGCGQCLQRSVCLRRTIIWDHFEILSDQAAISEPTNTYSQQNWGIGIRKILMMFVRLFKIRSISLQAKNVHQPFALVTQLCQWASPIGFREFDRNAKSISFK